MAAIAKYATAYGRRLRGAIPAQKYISAKITCNFSGIGFVAFPTLVKSITKKPYPNVKGSPSTTGGSLIASCGSSPRNSATDQRCLQ
jgi:hypothetical protein